MKLLDVLRCRGGTKEKAEIVYSVCDPKDDKVQKKNFLEVLAKMVKISINMIPDATEGAILCGDIITKKTHITM
jgi:hypothetical protein